ncbi:MAG: HigA family addiction module antitoxin [Ginsengibacter sp.]
MRTVKREMPIIHPGEFLADELIKANSLTVSEVEEMLHVSRQTISGIINKKSDISPEMALRISTVFGGTPDIWLRLQSKYDLQKAAKKVEQIKLTPYRPGRIA